MFIRPQCTYTIDDFSIYVESITPSLGPAPGIASTTSRIRSFQRSRRFRLDLSYFHIESHPESPLTPDHGDTTVKSPDPDWQRQKLPSQPRDEPVHERTSGSRAFAWRLSKRRRVFVQLDGFGGMQLDIKRPIHDDPGYHTQNEKCKECSPCGQQVCRLNTLIL